MKDAWTDDRLDDLNHRVDRGFEETRREFQTMRSELRAEFAAARAETQEMHRTMLQVVFGSLSLILVSFAGTIATIIIQA